MHMKPGVSKSAQPVLLARLTGREGDHDLNWSIRANLWKAEQESGIEWKLVLVRHCKPNINRTYPTFGHFNY